MWELGGGVWKEKGFVTCMFRYVSDTPPQKNKGGNIKIKTNKYLNNDITKLVPAVVTVTYGDMEMRQLKGKDHFLSAVTVQEIKWLLAEKRLQLFLQTNCFYCLSGFSIMVEEPRGHEEPRPRVPTSKEPLRWD